MMKKIDNRIYLNFKCDPKLKNKFKEIVEFRLLAQMSPVLEKLVQEVVDDWNAGEERKRGVLKRFFKLRK